MSDRPRLETETAAELDVLLVAILSAIHGLLTFTGATRGRILHGVLADDPLPP